MIPNNWQKEELSQILERVTLPVDVEPKKEYRQIGIRSHAKGIFYKKPVTGESLGNKRVFHIEENCFVVNIVFAWEHAIAKTTENEIGMIASHRFPMYRPKNNKCNIDYILYFFKSKLGKHMLGLASPGGAGRNKTLGQSEFYRLKVLIPPLEEQIKIAQIISLWDKAIITMEKLLANSQQQKKALTQQLLTGKRRLPGFIDKWKKIQFEKIIDIEIGGTPSRSKPEYWDEKKITSNRWLSIANLRGNVITDTSEYISDSGVKNSNVSLIPAGTIVMSFKLSIGRRAILGVDCYTNEAICALLIKDNRIVSNDYLYQALEVVNFDKEIDPAIKGKTLNKAKLKRLVLQVPSLDEQKKIASILIIEDKKIDNLQKKLDYINRERVALMQQLLTGKRRVKIN